MPDLRSNEGVKGDPAYPDNIIGDPGSDFDLRALDKWCGAAWDFLRR
jgi:hypothetical protein